MRVDLWLLLGLALLLGASAAVAPVEALAVTGALSLLVLCRVQSGWLVVGVGLAGVAVGAWRAQLALEHFEAERISARDQLGEPRRCAGDGVVRSRPRLRQGVMQSLVEFSVLDCEGVLLRGPLQVRLYGGPSELTRDSEVFVVAQLAALGLFRNVAVSNPTPLAARAGAVLSGSVLSLSVTRASQSYSARVDRARAWVRTRISATFTGEAKPLARALVLGENDLTETDDEAFRKSGLSHLLAVSGTHLVFAVVSLVAALRALLLRCYWLASSTDVTRIASACGIPLALGYADFSGGSGSAWRAAFMLVAVFLARACGRKPEPARVVGLTLGVGAALDPLVCFDISFMLSLAATGGLLVIGRPLVSFAERIESRVVRYLLVSLSATVASMLPCAPLLAMISPDLTLAGLVANVIAAPIGELVALPVCLIHATMAPLPALESGLGLVGSGALLAVRQIALYSSSVGWLAFQVPDPARWQLGVLVVGAAGFLLVGSGAAARSWKLVWAALGAGSLVLLETSLASGPRPAPRLRVHMLDVGQGDATLVELPAGGALLVDAGGFVGSPIDPGERVVLPWLRARRQRKLDIVVLSHPHPDHFGGLASVVANVRVGEFWDTGQGQREGAGPVYRSLIALLEQRGVPILGPRELCNAPRFREGVRLEVLAPCPAFVPGRDANDNSFVIKLSYGGRSFLLSGDAEAHEEAELVQRYGSQLRADVLKVGHHGSRTSTTPAFLAEVRPRFATLSSGVRNRFGHPHPQTLETLAARGVLGLRTDRMGSLSFVSDGTGLDVHAFQYPR